MFPSLKTASYAAGAAIFAYLGISAEMALVLAILLVIDTLTGSIRAMVIDHRNFSSSVLSRGVLSKLMLVLLPLTVALVAKGVGIDLSWLVSMTMGIIIVSEGYSIVANIGQIYKKDDKGSESDAVSFVISKILAVFRAILDTLFKK